MAGAVGPAADFDRVAAAGHARPPRFGDGEIVRLAPGILLCAAVSLAAMAAEVCERAVFHRAWVEALLLAILFGALVRTLWRPGRYWAPGIAFCNKTVLEAVVVLLGASVSLSVLAAVGPALVVGVIAVVMAMIPFSYAVGRALKLSPATALLVACGNAICGNSAIVAVASATDAPSEEVAAAIAFTAAAGVLVVLAMPALGAGLGFTAQRYGILAGLTVYAVPQVLAATASAGPVATQVGALVKLLRVMMLGPVVLFAGLAARRPVTARLPLRRLVPWFVAGFFLLALLRALGAIPPALVETTGGLTRPLTVLAMAGLGATVDLSAVARAGPRLSLAVAISILGLMGCAIGLILLVRPQ